MIAAPAHSEPSRAQPGAAGQSPPWGELFEQHHSRILRIAFRITGNSTDAEDVLQTVFLRLVRREEDVDFSGGAASYLYRAAVNAALDLLRARKRSRAVDLADVEADLSGPQTESPEHQHRRRELASWLRGAVAGLSPRAAEIFSLRYFEGHGNREIAEMLATSQTAVAVILHRTRHRLGSQLEPLLGGTTL